MPNTTKVLCKICERRTKRPSGVCMRCNSNQKKKDPSNYDYECMGGSKDTLKALRKPLNGLAPGV